MKHFYLLISIFLIAVTAQAKYDEWQFIPSSELSGKYVMHMAGDQSGNLIYAHTIAGSMMNPDHAIEVFDGENWTNITTDNYGYPYDSKNEISNISVDPDGRVWASTDGNPVYFENDEWHILSFPEEGEAKRRFEGIWADSRGNIYFFTYKFLDQGMYNETKITKRISNELWSYDGQALKKIIYIDSTGGDPRFSFFLAGEMSPTDDLWISVNRYEDTVNGLKAGGLLKINEDGYEFHDLPDIFENDDFYVVGDLLFDRDGMLWLLYEHVQLMGGSGYNFSNSQLGYFLDGQWTFLAEGNGFDKYFTRYIDNVLIDKNDVFWLGHSNRGLLRYENNIITQIPLAEIAGTSENGLERVICSAQGPDDRLWFSTARGLFVYDPDAVSVGESAAESDWPVVYPNPAMAGDEITIRLPENHSFGDININIYNTAGKKVYNTRVKSTGEIVIPSGSFSAGVYNAILQSGDKIECLSFTIIK